MAHQETINVSIRTMGKATVSYTFEKGTSLKSVIETAEVPFKTPKNVLSLNGVVTSDLETRLNENSDILITLNTELGNK